MARKLSKRKFLNILMDNYAAVTYAYIDNCVENKNVSERIFKTSWSKINSNIKYHQPDEVTCVWVFKIVTHTITTESLKYHHFVTDKENTLFDELLQLNDEDLKVLLMVFFEKKSYDSIALQLDVPSEDLENLINVSINKIGQKNNYINEMLFASSFSQKETSATSIQKRLEKLFDSIEDIVMLTNRVKKRLTFKKIIMSFGMTLIGATVLIFIASNFIDIKTSIPIIGKFSQSFIENEQSNEHPINMLQPEIIGDDVVVKFQIEDIDSDQLQVNVSIPSLTTDMITLDEYDQDGWFEFNYKLPSKAFRSDGFDIKFLFYNNQREFTNMTVQVDMKKILPFDYKIYAVNEEMTFDNAKLIIRNLHIREDTMVLKYEIIENNDTAFNNFYMYLQDDLGEVYHMDSSSYNSNSSWRTMYFNSKRFNPKAKKVEIHVSSTSYGSVLEIKPNADNILKFEYENEFYTLESNDRVSGNLSLMLKTEKMKLPYDFPLIFVRNDDQQYLAYLNIYEREYVHLSQSDVIEVFGSLENLTNVEDFTPLIDLVLDKYDDVISEEEILSNVETLLKQDVMLMRTKEYEETQMVNLMLYEDVAIDQLKFVYINEHFQVDLDSSVEITF